MSFDLKLKVLSCNIPLSCDTSLLNLVKNESKLVQLFQVRTWEITKNYLKIHLCSRPKTSWWISKYNSEPKNCLLWDRSRTLARKPVSSGNKSDKWKVVLTFKPLRKRIMICATHSHEGRCNWRHAFYSFLFCTTQFSWKLLLFCTVSKIWDYNTFR